MVTEELKSSIEQVANEICPENQVKKVVAASIEIVDARAVRTLSGASYAAGLWKSINKKYNGEIVAMAMEVLDNT